MSEIGICENDLKEVKCKVSRCNLCGRLNVCDEDKKEHAKSEHNGVIDVKDRYRESNKELSKMIGIQILAYERGYEFV